MDKREVIRMNMIFNKKDIVKEITEKLSDKRRAVGGNRLFYKRKYHLRYTQEIIEVVLDAFLDVLVDIIEDGDSVDIRGYLEIEPKYCKQWNGTDFNGNEISAPPRYKPRAKLKSEFVKACERLSERELYD